MTTLWMILCSVGWLVALLPLAGMFISTVMLMAGVEETKKTGVKIPYYAHISIFPVIFIAVIGAWIAHFVGVDNAFLFLLLPLLNIVVFIAGMINLERQ